MAALRVFVNLRHLRRLWDEGCTYGEAADELGVSYTTVRRIARRLGIVGQRGGRPDPDLRAMILGIIEAVPMTGTALSEILGRHKESVCRILRELERDGLVVREGKARLTRWHVTRAWA